MSLLNDASLVLIPSGYKEDKVYSIIPSDGSGDLDFVRGSDGTRINSLGQVENVCWNLYPYSEAFDNGFWLKNDLTITANNTIAPNGTTTADKVSDTIGTNQDHIFNYLMNFTAGTPYTASFYVKNIDINYFCIKFMTNAFGSIKNVIFDIQNGAITTQDAGITASIVNAGNGWYRCIATCTATITTNTLYGLYVGMTSSPTSTSYTSASIKSLYLWGAQLNVGNVKPYFPTTDRLNVPRLTYENGCPSLLLEKQSTNICLYSEQFDNAAWDKINVTVTANNIISPDGTQNADKIEYTNSNNYFITYCTNSQTISYTISCYAKKGSTDLFSLREVFYFGSNAKFDLTNGTIVSDTTGTAKIQSVGNGWYRCSITQAYTSGQTNMQWSFDNRLSTGNLYLWGAQIEASTYITSYIPTTSTSVTRLADSCYKTGISSLIGQTSGAMFCEFNYYDNISGSMELVPMYIGAGAYSDGIYFDIYQDVLYLAIWVSASQQTLINCGALNAGKHKVAVSYTANDIKVYLDGALIGSDNSASIPSMSQLNIGTAGSSTTVERYTFNQGLLFKRVLTSQEAIALTTL